MKKQPLSLFLCLFSSLPLSFCVFSLRLTYSSHKYLQQHVYTICYSPDESAPALPAIYLSPSCQPFLHICLDNAQMNCLSPSLSLSQMVKWFYPPPPCVFLCRLAQLAHSTQIISSPVLSFFFFSPPSFITITLSNVHRHASLGKREADSE